MEEIEELRSNFMSVNFNDEGEEIRSRTTIFSELKQYCIHLLELLQNPKKDLYFLSQLHRFLLRSSPDSLQPFFDYTLFPLLLLLDAAVDCRSSPNVDSKESSMMIDVPKTPHKMSDTVAEGVLQCLEELLKKCQLGSLDQMVVVLKKLTNGALLSPSEAAEEFRGGVIRCFRALLLSIRVCSFKSCSCKQNNGWPALLKRNEFQSPLIGVSRYNSEPECSLAFLQSQNASPAVGHWLSLLLKAADTEAVRGQRGSAKLRVEAFVTLRILVAKVGTADALSFFVPGVVSQFGKVLHVAKTMISGAAGSAESLDQAIRGLAEFLMIVLEDDANLSSLDESVDDITGLHPNKEKSPQSILEELRHLPVKTLEQSQIVSKDLRGELVDKSAPKVGFKEKVSKNRESMIGSLHVDRTKDWIVKTSAHVDKLLSATFPHLCVHPAKKVRQGLLAAIEGLLSKCCYTLKESRLMLLECLCVLACDDSEPVSEAAQGFLGYLFSSSGKHIIMHDVAQIFSRLVENLPKVVLGSEEALAISHAQKLLILIYFSGPQLVKDHLLQSPVTAARFLDAFALCLGQNSTFAGSLQKLILARPSSTGYLHSIAEMKAVSCFSNNDNPIMQAVPSKDTMYSSIQNKRILENVQNKFELPRMPPWFEYVGSHKLYQTLAGILRLVGLSLVADSRSEASLSVIADIPLGYLRKLVSEVRMKSYSKESWKSWYHRTGSGQLVRQASTAACILNEMIYGLSDQAVDAFSKVFHKSTLRWGKIEGYAVGGYDNMQKDKLGHGGPDDSVWKFCQNRDGRSQLIDCVGGILHEYLCHEVWDLPSERQSSFQQSDTNDGDITLHFFHDNAMLHQVVIDGIGIFNMCLGGEFSSCGFLHSSLYVLLENLICSNFQIRSTSDAVLHVLSATSGYPTVGHLVVANSDYIIDSICRQLRHLDLNPHVPNVLAAMLSYIGAAHKILPLLEEPMRSVSLELEILGRHQHPDLTIPFLKAVAEIARASRHEAVSLCSQAELYCKHVKSQMYSIGKETRLGSGCSVSDYGNETDLAPMDSEKEFTASFNNVDMPMEQLESTLLSLNDSRIYRRTVGSIVGSCVLAVTPLLVSVMQDASLVALDIIESIGSGPREPWHDLHCRIDGPAAYDILTNFEQRWKKAAKWRDLRLGKARHWHDDTLLKIERLSFILTPYSGPDGDQVVHVTTEEDPENWHVQVFLSIDSRSVKGFPKGVKEAEAQIHHIATHLLQAALKKVIGQETSQAGLLAAFDRLRFDFNFHRPLIDNEVMQIESLTNRWIGDAALLQTKVMPIAEAKRAGAIATFGEKYGDQVKAEEVTTTVDALLEELRMVKNEVSKIRAKAAVYKASIIAGKAVTVGSSKEISYEPKAAITGVIHDYVPYKSSSMERAQEVQANLLPELPSFAKPMLPSHVAGGFWL